MTAIPAAYPYISVNINLAGLVPVAQRQPGVIAIVGKAQSGGGNVGSAPVNVPLVVATLADAGQFAALNADGSISAHTALYDSLLLAMQQNPAPQKIYAVKVDADNYEAALSALDSVGDVTFVSLANETDPGAAPPAAPTHLGLLKQHVESASSQGNKRIGFAMLDPTKPRTPTYANDMDAAVSPELKSASGRMVVIAARGATSDAATAAMAALAGYAPAVSPILKPIAGITIAPQDRYTPGEIAALSEKDIIPIVSPALLVGGGMYFGEARVYSTNAALQYVDTVRVLDDIDFRLKAGLIGAIGDARMTKVGLRQIATRIDGILQVAQTAQMIDSYAYAIPVLDILSKPESGWTDGERTAVNTARGDRTLDVYLDIVLGPNVHHIIVELKPSYT